jgi:hypothetical protein
MERSFRWLFGLAILQDSVLCIAITFGLGRIDFSTYQSFSGVGIDVFLMIFSISALMLPFSLGLAFWGLLLLRRSRIRGETIGSPLWVAIGVAEAPIIVVVIYLIVLAVTLA